MVNKIENKVVNGKIYLNDFELQDFKKYLSEFKSHSNNEVVLLENLTFNGIKIVTFFGDNTSSISSLNNLNKSINLSSIKII